MKKTPIIKMNLEGVTVVINSFQIEFNPEVSTLENSSNLFVHIYRPLGYERPIVSSNHLYVDFQLVVKEPTLELPAIVALFNTLLSSDEPITDKKHLWNLFDDGMNMIREEINEKQVKDKNGNLLSMPRNNFAPGQLEGWI